MNMDNNNYGNTTIYTIGIGKIKNNELNSTYKVDDVKELRQSIEQYGLKQPLTVIKDGDDYKLISGHRRLKAIKEIYSDGGTIKFAGKEYNGLVPCIFESEFQDKDEEFLNLVSSNSYRKLSPEEMSALVHKAREIYERRLENGEIVKDDTPTRDVIGKMINVSGRTVDKYLKEDRDNEKNNEKVRNIKLIAKDIDKAISNVKEIKFDEYGKTNRQVIKDKLSELIAACKSIK